MKLQGLSIVFGLIIIPIVLVLSYYIQLQIETIDLQTEYDTKLLDATHDAMVAFELNTANEDYSSNADSLRSIVDASSNLFMNTISMNMGLSNASKSRLEPYIPAILYTLYDGYYINSPTKVPQIAVDSKGVALEIDSNPSNQNKFSVPGLSYNGSEYEYNPMDTDYYTINSYVPAEDFGQLLYKKTNGKYTTNINDSDISYSSDHVLKSYMPYSARYLRGNKDVIINYTLDNYITVVANINGSTYAKSGYLIDLNLVTEAKIGSEDLLNYTENEAEEKIKQAFSLSSEVTIKLNVEDNSVDPPVTSEIIIKTNDANSDEAAAIIYYTKAKIFSNWVYTNLGDLEESDIVENMSDEIRGTTQKGIEEVIYSFKEKNNKIFDVSQNPEEDNSIFINHKIQVIRNAIQYNLNLAMSIYNERTTSSYDFNMPVISGQEWEKITKNISVVTFMQGVKCGLKTYSNYAVVSSTNNELTVIPSEIYYVKEGNSSYHRIDCPQLKEELAGGTSNLISFVSKEVKYDKIFDKTTNKYIYDHEYLACYTCIVDGNYTSEILDNIRKKEYYIAVGKERNNIYKMNSIND